MNCPSRIHVASFAWLSAVTLLASGTASAQAPDGAAIFAKNCTSCHSGATDTRAPAPDILRQRSPEAILSALTAGSMRPQGGVLSGAERRAVAEYLSGKSLGGDVTGAATANRAARRRGAAGRRRQRTRAFKRLNKPGSLPTTSRASP